MTPVAGRMVDRIGRMETAVPAAIIMALAMAATTLTSDLNQLLGLVATWSIAGSVLSVAPTADVTDASNPKERAQALALLRTGGDIGMLSGSILAGVIADQSSNLQAIQINGTIMMAVAAVTGVRVWNTLRQNQ